MSLIETSEKVYPLYTRPNYTNHDLLNLLEMVRNVKGSGCICIKNALLNSDLRISVFWSEIKKQDTPTRWIFSYPYDDLWILKKSSSSYVQTVIKWRLKIGK